MLPDVGFKVVIITTAIGAGIYFLFLSILSGLVKDLAFPRLEPGWFVAEIIITAVLSGLVRVFVVYSRNKSLKSLAKSWYGILIAMVIYALLHILFQFSGFYSKQFPVSTYTRIT